MKFISFSISNLFSKELQYNSENYHNNDWIEKVFTDNIERM